MECAGTVATALWLEAALYMIDQTRLAEVKHSRSKAVLRFGCRRSPDAAVAPALVIPRLR